MIDAKDIKARRDRYRRIGIKEKYMIRGYSYKIPDVKLPRWLRGDKEK